MTRKLHGAAARPPQSIAKHSAPIAVVLSQRDDERLVQRPRTSLLDFLAASPLADLDLGRRDRTDIDRAVEL